MEKSTGLLSEVLENITAVYSYLAEDLAKEKLSSTNKKNRNLFIQRLDGLIKKIKLANENTPPLSSNNSHPPPSLPQRPPPLSKPPPIPPTTDNDDGGEVYEVPDKDTSEQYTSFLPIATEDEPQEDYLAMEAEQREEITEETYEDPNLTLQEQEPEPGLYEDPLVNPQSEPLSPQLPTSPRGYMDPAVTLTEEDKRNSMAVPVHLIDSWEDAYDITNMSKKKEKIKASKLSNVLVKGWLEKLGGRSHNNWQKRYCVLAAMFMYFYEKESSGTYNNRIPIPGFQAAPSADLTRPKRNLYAFKLSSIESTGTGKAKNYYFRAKTEAERDQWVEVIKKIFDQGRAVIERKKSQTLPLTSPSNRSGFVGGVNHHPIEEPIQEDYEAITPAVIEEEDDQEDYIDVSQANEAIAEETGSQEEYVEVRPGETDEPQEDYVEPSEIRQTLNRQSTSNSSFAPPLPPPPTSSVTKLPLPPPPPTQASTTPSVTQQPLPAIPPPRRPDPVIDTEKTTTPSVTQQPLPAIPPPRRPDPVIDTDKTTTPSVTQQPLPAIPPPRRPDPVIDTDKIYLQTQNGLQYDKIYVLLWDFNGSDNDELQAKRGDLLFVTDPTKTQEWWFGEVISQDCSRKIGPTGLFPASYSTIAFEAVV